MIRRKALESIVGYQHGLAEDLETSLNFHTKGWKSKYVCEPLMNTSDNFTGPVNLGNSDEFTILELAELIVDLTKSNSKIVFKPLPQDDPVRRRPDISLAKEKLKWSPNIKLHEGLVKTIEYFDKLLVQIPQKQASLRN